MTNSLIVKKITLSISLLLYIGSLIYPAFCTINSCYENLGIILLFFGGIAFFQGGAGLIWLGNPILFYSWIKIKNEKKSLIGSGIATALCISFLFFKNVPNPGTCGSFLEPMPCGDLEITEIKLGYILWAASAGVLFAGNCLRFLLRKN